MCLTEGIVIVAGMGEVGRPLLRILRRNFDCVAVDIDPVEVNKPCRVLHVCYPFQLSDFCGTTAQYIQKYDATLTIIHSTVAPGTTRRIQERLAGRAVTYSPVRGKHANMEADMLRYKKFVAGFDSKAVDFSRRHLGQAGFQTATLRTPEIAELSKLLETSYLGVLVGWTQEVERFAARFGASFEEVNSFIKEVDFLPSHVSPGFIGGHCVMPNIAILQKQFTSDFLDAIVRSNKAKEAGI
jgi:UDP-N-acetyl-D-mannosaminuronate dehydrogenase